MSLTPADIHNIAFKKPPMGKRGYDEEEVDAFLDEVEQELIRLLEENNALQDQLQRGPSSAPGSTMVINSELAGLAAQLERMREARARAEDRARSVQAQLEEARATAASTPMRTPVMDDPRLNAVLMMAQRTADDHMRDAQQESESLLAEARNKADQITQEAKAKADDIEGDARRNHTDAINSLETKRSAALEEIDRLGQLSKSYQQALDAHLTQQLEELNSVAKSI